MRSIEGLPREESSARITWEQIAATGLPSAGVLVLERSVQIRSDEVLHSPQEGLQLRVEERSGALRLLRGSAPSLLDVTAEHPALAALLGPASGRSPLLPSRPLRAGESWTIPLGRYLDATSLPAARTLGGTVRARLLGFDEHRARLTFEVDLSTSGSAGTRTAIHFNGRALLDRDLGLVLERRLQGRIERGASRRSLEVSIDIEVLPRAR